MSSFLYLVSIEQGIRCEAVQCGSSGAHLCNDVLADFINYCTLNNISLISVSEFWFDNEDFVYKDYNPEIHF